MKTFTHKPTQAEAIRVGRPWINITKAFPFSRQIKTQGGKLKYFLLSRPGEPGGQMAHEGDWIVKHDGVVEVLPDELFQERYVEGSDFQLVATGALAPRPTPPEEYVDHAHVAVEGSASE